MGDRFLLWLGAGAVTAGVTVGMLAGAGMAYGQTGSNADGGATSSQSDNSGGQGNDAAGQDQKPTHKNTVDKHAIVNGTDKTTVDKGAVGTDKVDNDPQVKPDPGVVTGADVEQTGRKADKPDTRRVTGLVNSVVATLTHKPARKVVVDRTDPVEKVAVEKLADDKTDAVEKAAAEPAAAVPQATVVTDDQQAPPVQQNLPTQRVDTALFSTTESHVALPTPMLARAPVTQSAAQVRVPPIVSLVGTLVFGVISLAESVIEGPPMVPPALRDDVTVKRSTLTIGGDEVPADWYFPTSQTPPQGIIYLQHGFLARGVFYDYTAAYLAKETNSIVVAPTLTSNFFATDGMWLGGDPMHRAVADLFNDGNGALMTSATAAGYTQDQLPQQVVLIGHSLGGGLVIDTARYMVANRNNGDATYYELAGVLMLDGVSFADPVPILQQIPDSIPVYNLSATPYMWNLFGTMDAALAQVRGDQFHGAQLLGGLHSDAMIGGNPLIQFGAYLVTGFSLPSNVAGSQILAAGWINDMFTGTRTPGLYGDPGSTLTIPTSAGTAHALVAPTPGVVVSLLRQVTRTLVGLAANIDFATSAAPELSITPVPTAVTPTIPAIGMTGLSPPGDTAAQTLGAGWINTMSAPRGPPVELSPLEKVVTAWSALVRTILFGQPATVATAAVAAPGGTETATQQDTGVIVGHSNLTIPCGDGVTVPADWYMPDVGNPTGVIYLQHGFLRANDNMSSLATSLARETNSIVVVPTVSSNFLDCSGCWINGASMQKGVADLFVGDRMALTASARAAFGDCTLELPEDFILAGHSAGGNLATGAAGYYVEGNGSAGDLKGVILFDAVDNGNTMQTALAKIDAVAPMLPVYQIAAEPCLCNSFGSGTRALIKSRPGQFVGVRLTGGTHIDSEGASTDFLAVLACGLPRPSNVEAVPTIAAGWINDIYNGTDYGVYGTPGERIQVGRATAVVLR